MDILIPSSTKWHGSDVYVQKNTTSICTRTTKDEYVTSDIVEADIWFIDIE